MWTPETIALASGVSVKPADEGSKSARGQGLQKVKTPPQLRKVAEDEGLAEKVLREERADPFDPEEFNRMVQDRFGGGAAAGVQGRP